MAHQQHAAAGHLVTMERIQKSGRHPICRARVAQQRKEVQKSMAAYKIKATAQKQKTGLVELHLIACSIAVGMDLSIPHTP